jgi:hypothetical protein
MLEIITELLDKAPWLQTVFIVIGVLRVVFKPLFSLLQAAALATPTLKDDSIIKDIMESKIYLGIAYVLDYLGSIKLPKSEQK